MKQSKLTAVLLTLTLGIGTGIVDTGYLMSPHDVLAADTATTGESTPQSDFKWSFDSVNKTATVTGANVWFGQSGNTESSVVIPDTVTNDGQTYKVTSIGSHAFDYQDGVVSVTLPKYLTTIGESAFAYLKNLTNVDFSQATNLKTIGNLAFVGLQQTTPITLPDSVTTIGRLAFAYAHVSQVNLGQSVQTIGEKAFAAMDNLAKVSLNSNLVSIGDQAFVYDSKLSDVNWSDATSLKDIGEGAFVYAGLKGTIPIPAAVQSIGNQAFAGNQITGVTFDDALKTIGTSAFAYNKITNTVTIPKGVTSVGIQAFVGNLIKEVDLLGSSSIGADAFTQNNITKISSPSAQLPTSGAVGQVATIVADQATVSIGDLFSIDTNGKTNQNIDISNLTNGVTYDQSTGKFNVPAKTTQFSFTWTLKDNNNQLYSGNYTVDRTVPTIKAHPSTIYIGDSWKAGDNYDGQDLDKMTVTVKDQSGKTLSSVDTSKAGTYYVTYAYGNDSTTVPVVVAKKSITYGLIGSQTVDYNGQVQQPTLSNYSVSLSSGDSYTLKDGDIAVKDNAADAKTYQVDLTDQGQKNIEAAYGDKYNLTQDSSGATFTIRDENATASLNDGTKVYDGQAASKSYQPTVTVKDSSGNSLGTMALSAGQYEIVGDDSKVGSYPIKLTATGIAAIKAKFPNIAFSDLSAVSATYTITPNENVVATLSGGSKTYDGKKVSESGFTPTLTLKDGDNVIATVKLEKGQYDIADDDSKVGSYSITIAANEIAQLKTTYSNYDLSKLTSVKSTYTILAPHQVSYTIQGSQSVGFDGKVHLPAASHFTITMSDGTKVALQDSDLMVADHENGVTDAGSYRVVLSDSGKTRIAGILGASNQLVDGTSTATLTVTKQKGTASLTDGSKVYDGKKVSQSNYQPTLTLRDANGTTQATIKLTADQYSIENDGSAVGSYSITLTSAEIKALQAKYPNDDFNLNAVKATYTITAQPTPKPTPGGNGGGGSSATPTTPSTPSSNDNSSSSSSTIVEPSTVAKKGAVVYAIKKIGLYGSKDFKQRSRKAWYVQKPRIYRPMFVITGYSRDGHGNLRYKVRDVNHLTKNRNQTGYITASWKYVRPVYYQSRESTITEINPRGVNGYRKVNLTRKVTNYKQGTVLKVKKVVNYHLTTRFILDNGQYVTANRKLVQMGHRRLPKSVRAKGAINRYANVNLTKKNKHYPKSAHKRFKVYGFDYSDANSVSHHGRLRYRVANGYITGSTKYISIFK